MTFFCILFSKCLQLQLLMNVEMLSITLARRQNETNEAAMDKQNVSNEGERRISKSPTSQLLFFQVRQKNVNQLLLMVE